MSILFIPLGQENRNWTGMGADANGNIYACEPNGDHGDIYERIGGMEDFIAQELSPKYWTSIAVNELGDVYICAMGDDIYKNSLPLSQGAFDWTGLCVAPNGDVYACASGSTHGGIYKQAFGESIFISISAGNRDWTSITAAPNGDVYACVNGGGIYKQAFGESIFISTSAGNKYWFGITTAPNGDVYACVSLEDIYKQAFGESTFVGLGQTPRAWHGITAAPNGDIYACALGGDIYIFSDAPPPPPPSIPLIVCTMPVTPKSVLTKQGRIDFKINTIDNTDGSSGLENDFAKENFDLVLIDGKEQIRQQLKIRLQFFSGEWYLDTTLGVRFYQDILIKNPQLTKLQSLFKAVIMGTVGVTRLVVFDLTVDNQNRSMTLAFTVDTLYGIITTQENL